MLTGRKIPFENLVAATYAAEISHSLAGVMNSWNQSSISGELSCAPDGTKGSHVHQELDPEPRTHAWQASEDPRLDTVPMDIIQELYRGDT